MSKKNWAGLAIVGVASLLYGWHGITGTLDLLWHGGMFFLGLGLMLPQHYFDYALATIQSVFGKQAVQPPADYPPPPGGQEGRFPTGEGKS